MKKCLLKVSVSSVLASSMILSSGFMCLADETEEAVPEETDAVCEDVSEEDSDEAEELDVPELISEETEDFEEVIFDETEIEVIEEESLDDDAVVTEEDAEDVLATGDVTINKTNFPDSAFRSFVSENYDKDNDGKLSKSEADAVLTIDVDDLGITDLKGIGNFKNLIQLSCSDNDLTSINVSSNTKLRALVADGNSFTSINIKSNPWLCLSYQYAMTMDENGSILYYASFGGNVAGMVLDSDVVINAKKDSDLGLGWKKSSNGKWWFKLPDNLYPSESIIYVNEEYYYFDDAGYMVTGWFKYANTIWMYADSSGKVLSGWQKISGKWYYLGSKSAPFMYVGFRTIDNKTYYFNENGAMQTGWQQNGDLWFYFGSSGAAVTGWKKIGSYWYYFKSNGVMETGWHKSGSDWYYLDTNGHMLASCSRKIDGKTYRFDANGVCLNP